MNDTLLAECFVLFKSFCQVQRYLGFRGKLVVCPLCGCFVTGRSFLLLTERDSILFLGKLFEKGEVQEILVLTLKARRSLKVIYSVFLNSMLGSLQCPPSSTVLA